MSQDQDVIQIDNNMETLAMAKNKIGLVRAVKTQGVLARPKGKTFH